MVRLCVIVCQAANDGVRASKTRILVMPFECRKLDSTEILPILCGGAGFCSLKMPGLEREKTKGAEEQQSDRASQEEDRHSLQATWRCHPRRRVRWMISDGALVRKGNQLPTPLETMRWLSPFM